VKAQGETRLSLQRAHLNAGGYDRAGAYWGIGAPLWCYSDEAGKITGYVRAADRGKAKAAILREQPKATFLR